jgi:hypothetical protein
MGGPPYPPPPPPPAYPGRYYRRRRGGSVIWPMVLILAGVIFLLQNFGIVTPQIWSSIGRLWPVILILIGLEIFLSGAGRGIFAVVVILVLAMVIAAVIGMGVVGSAVDAAPAGPLTSHTLIQSLQGATSASVSLHLGAGTLGISQLDGGGDDLAEMSYDGPDKLAPSSSYRVRNGQGQLSYVVHGTPPWHLPFANQGNPSGQVNLLLAPDVPLTLSIQEGASESRIDLSQLRVSNLDLQTGASHTRLVLPQNAGTTAASIKGGAATIDVEVPQGVAAAIQYEGGLSTLDVDQNRFPATGPRAYRSADYDTASNRVDLNIQAGVATVSIR